MKATANIISKIMHDALENIEAFTGLKIDDNARHEIALALHGGLYVPYRAGHVAIGAAAPNHSPFDGITLARQSSDAALRLGGWQPAYLAPIGTAVMCHHELAGHDYDCPGMYHGDAWAVQLFFIVGDKVIKTPTHFKYI